MSPSLSEDFTLFINLVLDIVAQILQSLLEFILEGVQSCMNVIHCIYCLLTILLNFTATKSGKYRNR